MNRSTAKRLQAASSSSSIGGHVHRLYDKLNSAIVHRIVFDFDLIESTDERQQSHVFERRHKTTNGTRAEFPAAVPQIASDWSSVDQRVIAHARSRRVPNDCEPIDCADDSSKRGRGWTSWLAYKSGQFLPTDLTNAGFVAVAGAVSYMPRHGVLAAGS